MIDYAVKKSWLGWRLFTWELHTAVLIKKAIARMNYDIVNTNGIYTMARYTLERAILSIDAYYMPLVETFGENTIYIPKMAYRHLREIAVYAPNYAPDPVVSDHDLREFYYNDIPDFEEAVNSMIEHAREFGIASLGNNLLTPEQALREAGIEVKPESISL